MLCAVCTASMCAAAEQPILGTGTRAAAPRTGGSARQFGYRLVNICNSRKANKDLKDTDAHVVAHAQ